MRYLGLIHKQLSQPESEDNANMKGDFKHLRALIEREIVLRCAKHVFKQYLRDQLSFSSLHISHCVSHLLNLVFCPTPFIHTLNNGTVKFSDDTVQQNFSAFPDICQTHSTEKKEEEVKAPVSTNEQELSKK